MPIDLRASWDLQSRGVKVRGGSYQLPLRPVLHLASMFAPVTISGLVVGALSGAFGRRC